ncbi:MAG: DNA polymerase III subunit epsilon [Gammaproteobacteria bacterium]|nr:DNA polymerase III subunit epsilon [Pseudomonadales bacterium]MCP5346349.1 DNA polymerase III subunit epsilon [Pseudomonadales bacterium]
MRQIVLDTETTGLDPAQGHRVIEIGGVEIDNRRLTGRHFHYYLNPDRESDEGALEVHGLTSEFLADKPRFPQIVSEFIEFVKGAELVIHNAPFDVGFLNNEIQLLKSGKFEALETYCEIVDSLALARQKHPGQRNNLDALCKRYEVDNSQRELHGALLDAEILADVYLAMTGGQTRLQLGAEEQTVATAVRRVKVFDGKRPPLKVIRANAGELESHSERLEAINKASGENCVWLRLEPQ